MTQAIPTFDPTAKAGLIRSQKTERLAMHQASNTVPTFSPLGTLTFVAGQLRQVLADDPRRCEELQGTIVLNDYVHVPIVVFENWSNMLSGSMAGLRSKE